MLLAFTTTLAISTACEAQSGTIRLDKDADKSTLHIMLSDTVDSKYRYGKSKWFEFDTVKQWIIDDIPNGSVIEITKAEADSIVEANGVIPGATYKITDRGDRGIILNGIDSTNFSPTGTRIMLCPKTYKTEALDGNNWLGVWNEDLTPSTGDLAIWGAHVWRNLNANVGAEDSSYELNEEWELVEKSTFENSEYVVMVFGVSYSLTNDVIGLQWDGMGNIFGYGNFGDPDDPIVNHCDWNIGTKMVDNFYNNVCRGVLNNICSNIRENRLIGGYLIYSNRVNAINENFNNGDIGDNKFNGSIQNNRNENDIHGNELIGSASISWNSCLGSIEENTNSGDISANSNLGSISSNSNLGSIANNNNLDGISQNSNGGDIILNSNGGGIYDNSHDGVIEQNNNNGNIMNCVGSSGYGVHHNVNNGDIDNPDLSSADVTDTIVNK